MSNLKVSDIVVKKLKQEDDELTFAIKDTVSRFAKDYFGQDDNVIVEIQGVDKDGFERMSVMLQGIIPVNTTKILTTKDSYFDDDFDERNNVSLLIP